jgi:methylmalonyl-CoA/ethylmalonyl-CoA epimerase
MYKQILVIAVMLAVLFMIAAAQAPAEKKEAAEMTETVSKPLPSRGVVQIAVVVRDVEKAAKTWAEFFGMEVPKTSLTDPPEDSHATYRGKPTEARAKLAFLKMDNLQIELIEPVGEPSTWMDFLKANGEGVHHIAFDVKGMNEQIANLGKKGMPLIQFGEWTAYTGGCYAYFDSIKQLGVVIELLENY